LRSSLPVLSYERDESGIDRARTGAVMKKTFKILPVLAVGLIAQTTPAHADTSFFDSISQAFHNVSNTIRNDINNWTGGGQQTNDPDSQAAYDASQNFAAVASNPSPSPSPSPTGPDLAQCRQYLSDLYDISEGNTPQKVATIYLNGVLDFMVNADPDAKLSDQEIAQRNSCVVLALNAGADPNSNGVYYDPDGMGNSDVPVPLVRAVTDNDEPAVKTLLDNKADPNAVDNTMGGPIPLLKSSLYQSQDISVDLINAGADVTVKDLLWTAAANADDKVVDALLQTKKIPVNQVDKFTDFPDDQGETALDVSEQAVYALKGYQKKFSANSTATVQQKIEDANHILYYTYPLKPQLKYPANGAAPAIDPDTLISKLLTRQQSISTELKAAGWTCIEDKCGIIDLTDDE
jgi:hypothetical protein